MNKIVFEHYPVSKLPAELREGLENGELVRVVIEKEEQAAGESDRFSGFQALSMPQPKPMTIEEAIAIARRTRPKNKPEVTPEEAVARIRALRDEWDD